MAFSPQWRWVLARRVQAELSVSGRTVLSHSWGDVTMGRRYAQGSFLLSGSPAVEVPGRGVSFSTSQPRHNGDIFHHMRLCLQKGSFSIPRKSKPACFRPESQVEISFPFLWHRQTDREPLLKA